MAEHGSLTELPALQAADEPPSAVQAWASVLGLLETAVFAAEKTLADPLGPLTVTGQLAGAGTQEWSPPAVQGQLPAEWQQRAQALAEAQQRIAARLAAAKLAVARQLAAVDSIPVEPPAQRAVYLDVRG